MDLSQKRDSSKICICGIPKAHFDLFRCDLARSIVIIGFGAFDSIWRDSARFSAIRRVSLRFDFRQCDLIRFGAFRRDSIWFGAFGAIRRVSEYQTPSYIIYVRKPSVSETSARSFRVNLHGFVAANSPIKFWLEKRAFRNIFGRSILFGLKLASLERSRVNSHVRRPFGTPFV